MKCFYHSVDLDGHCSGAIVKRAYPDCEMIGINYGDKFPWQQVYEGEIAKIHGGGGHKQAAGFQCSLLPFTLGGKS